jgi:tripartite-type tricarboxylate transporter receptor subunit TctC
MERTSMKFVRTAVVVLSGVAAALLTTAAAAFPTGPVRYVVPAPPGGLIDIMARQIAQSAGNSLGQPLVIDNKPGGNTTVGAALVARAAPDGQTWLGSTISLAANASLVQKLPFDPKRDLIPVALLASTPMGIVVPANSPFDNIKDLVKVARDGKLLNYGTSGSGTPAHLGTAMFEGAAGFKGNHIPYKGGAPLLNDMLGGQLDFTLIALSEARQFIASGRLKLIAVSSPKRLKMYPDVPTIVEAGFPSVVMEGWTGIMVPGGTPQPIVDRIAQFVLGIVTTPEFTKRAEELGYVMSPLGPAEFRQKFNDDVDRLRALIQARGIKAEM